MYDCEPATVQAWLRGERDAVDTLFTIYYPRAVRLAVLSGLEAEEAEDCAQEAFLAAFERRKQLRNPNALPLWFHRIITRRILDYLQARQSKKEVSLENAILFEDWERHQEALPDEIAIVSEQRAWLWSNIQKLAPQYRVPLVLRYYGGFSVQEVAKMMEKREGTIRVTVHRALQQLGLLLKEEHVLAANSVVSFAQTTHLEVTQL